MLKFSPFPFRFDFVIGAVTKQKKNVDFYCWLRKWELCFLESMERQLQLQLKMIFL